MDEYHDECKGCIKTLEPSESYDVIHLCEEKLGCNMTEGMPEFDTIHYNIEMMESELKTMCHCKIVIPRDLF